MSKDSAYIRTVMEEASFVNPADNDISVRVFVKVAYVHIKQGKDTVSLSPSDIEWVRQALSDSHDLIKMSEENPTDK